jgi:hypothetical protein
MSERTYAVTANRLNLRRAAGVDAGILSVLSKGATVEPHGELDDAWWAVRTAGGLEGYVARRYLAPLSAEPPVVPAAANRVIWDATTAAAGRVGYKLGAKRSADGRIDCSGWVAEVTAAAFEAINAASAPETVFDKTDAAALQTHSDGIITRTEARTGFALHGADVAETALREGMLIGCNFGEHTWELGTPPRVYGIDHIVQVVRDPVGGDLWITQSSSSGGGVNRLNLRNWLADISQRGFMTGRRVHAVDPFLMADRATQFVTLSRTTANLTAPPSAPLGSEPPAETPLNTLSEAASQLIVEFEIGGRAAYDARYTHPTWPRAASGVTIGVGHDLRFTTPAAFDRNWAALPAEARDRLRATIGKGGLAAKACIPAVADITVPWMVALAVYRAIDIPLMERKTREALPNCDRLAPDCFGVLVSLGFNRGPDYTTKGDDAIDRRKEMRLIRGAMAEQRFAEIPGLIRAMTRVWRGEEIERGMARRREAEAALFERGLAGAAIATQILPEAEAAAVPVVDIASEDSFDHTTLEAAVARAIAPPQETEDAQADLLARAQVGWAPDDRSPDYAHLRALPAASTRFSLRATDLEQLAAANSFPLSDAGDIVLFGLRGCGIIAATEEFADEAILLDRRPDHHTARCVMGVWNRTSGKIAVFPASTVPNAKAVRQWRNVGDIGNMLPTGFYRYVTGTHNSRPGCLVLRKAGGEKRVVVVRRSSDNLRYERTDMFQKCAPGDNLHPSFFGNTEGFSSYGCQVVVGSATNAGVHTGPWSAFRRAAGLPARGARDDLPFPYLLLTGAEAQMASLLRRQGQVPGAAGWAELRRLRFGSRGDAVLRLQQALGLTAPDGDFGANTAVALHTAQAARLEGRSDGILTAEFAAAMGWAVFA